MAGELSEQWVMHAVYQNKVKSTSKFGSEARSPLLQQRKDRVQGADGDNEDLGRLDYLQRKKTEIVPNAALIEEELTTRLWRVTMPI